MSYDIVNVEDNEEEEDVVLILNPVRADRFPVVIRHATNRVRITPQPIVDLSTIDSDEEVQVTECSSLLQEEVPQNQGKQVPKLGENRVPKFNLDTGSEDKSSPLQTNKPTQIGTTQKERVNHCTQQNEQRNATRQNPRREHHLRAQQVQQSATIQADENNVVKVKPWKEHKQQREHRKLDEKERRIKAQSFQSTQIRNEYIDYGDDEMELAPGAAFKTMSPYLPKRPFLSSRREESGSTKRKKLLAKVLNLNIPVQQQSLSLRSSQLRQISKQSF